MHAEVIESELQTESSFEAAERKFYELTKTLQTGDTLKMDFSDIEKLLEKDGRELLRLLLQAHVDSRGEGDIGRSVSGAEGILRTHKRLGSRQIQSIFGRIECERIGYGQRDTTSLFPKESHLNLPENSHSYELQRRVALEVVKGSFDQAVESIMESTGQCIPKQQVEHIAVAVSEDFDAFYEKKVRLEVIEEAKKAPLMVLTTDGKGIVMHRDDLRPSTGKKAQASEKKLEKRLSSGEKRNSKRMATVASVYNIERFVRGPNDFRNELASIKIVEEVADLATIL